MAALTKDRMTLYKGAGIEFEVPMKASTTIYKGSIVMFAAAGYAIPGADTSGCSFAGIALEQKTSGGSDGDTRIRVRRGNLVLLPTASVTVADHGEAAVISDDQTLTNAATATNDVRVGIFVEYAPSGQGGGANTAWVLTD